MIPVIIIETAGLLAAVTALALAVTGSTVALSRSAIRVFYGLVLALISIHAVSVLEWSWSARNLDPFSDFIKTLLPLMWLFFFYVYLHDREHEQSLEKEKKFRTLMEQSLAGMYIIQDGRFVYTNAKLLEIFGYTKEELKHIPSVLELVHEDDRRIVTDNIKRRIYGELESVSYRFRGLRKDAGEIHVEVYGTLTTWKDQPAIIGILVDITDRELLQRDLTEKERKLETLMGNLPGMVYRCRNDHDWTMEYISDGCINLTGYASSELILNATVAYADLITPEYRDYVWNSIQTAIKSDIPYRLEYQIRTRNNEEKWVWEQGGGYYSDGELVALEGFIMDITAHKQAELAVLQTEQRLRDIVEANPSVIYLGRFDQNNLTCSFVTENLADLLGYDSSEITGDQAFWYGHIHPDDRRTVIRSLNKLTENDNDIIEYRMRHRNGDYRWICDSRKIIHHRDGLELVGAWSDVSNVHELTEKLSYSENYDRLTGLINRRECDRRITQLLDNCRIDNSQHAFCELNIDQFKVINDTCGSLAGDSLLQAITGMLSGRVRKADRLACLGGDEFGVLLADCASKEAENVAADLLDMINRFRFDWNNRTYRVSARFGIAVFDKEIPDAQTVFSQANIACRTAREQGGNCVHVYDREDEISGRMHDEMQWAAQLHEALEKDRFLLYCQSIVPVTGPIRERHLEILVRMKDVDGKAISPGLFLPAAEKYGLAVKLDCWVTNKVFEFFRSRPERLEDMGTCAINLSGQSVGNNRFLQTVISNIEKEIIPNEKLCFEITETSLVSNLSVAIKFINTLKEYGCRFSLDDFGTGFSSYAYLKSMPVDYLKIDGCFIRNIMDDTIDLALVNSINEIAHVMGKKTIAEFVENDGILARLANLGVDYAQGYGIGKPEPLDGVITA